MPPNADEQFHKKIKGKKWLKIAKNGQKFFDVKIQVSN